MGDVLTQMTLRWLHPCHFDERNLHVSPYNTSRSIEQFPNEVTMPVFVDEAGDPGFKFERGSTRYFVVALLFVDTAGAVEEAVENLRLELGLRQGYEFKFYQSSDRIRERFLQTLVRQGVTIRAVIVDKTRIDVKLRDPRGFYGFLLQVVIQQYIESLRGQLLVLDQAAKGHRSKRGLSSSLRKALKAGQSEPVVRDIQHRASHSDRLIQAADMVCGSIFRAHEENDRRFIEIIQPRIEDTRNWP